MKPNPTRILVLGIIALLQVMLNAQANQVISLSNPGFDYAVGCEVSGPGGNSITNKAFLDASQLPDFSELAMFQCGGSPDGTNYQVYYSDSTSPSGWDDADLNPLGSNVVWNPGEGVLIIPAGAATLTLIGTNPTPLLPPANYCGCDSWSFLSAQGTNVIGSFQEVTGFSPSTGAQVYMFSSSTGGYQTYTYSTSTGWSPATPVLSPYSAGYYYVPCQDTCPPITLSPRSLAAGVAGFSYSQTITAAGGTAPYSFALTSGALPAGLSLSSGGQISGIPATAGNATFTVTATDTNGCTGGTNFILIVSNGAPLTLLSTYILCDDTNLVAAFSNPLAAGVATNLSNFHVSFGGEAFNVVASAQLGDDPRLLSIALPVSPAELDGNYDLSFTGVTDTNGNTFSQTNVPILCATNICNYSSSGTRFWLTFPGNYAPDPNNPPQVELYITGAPGVVGTVSIPGLASPFINNFTIPAGGTVSVALPSAADLGNANDVVGTNGIDVVASQPVTVDGFDHVPFTTDAYLGLPTRSLGSSYMVMSYSNVYSGIPDLDGSQFAIVATANNTLVTIVPPVQVGAHPANTPFNITLMQGQTYQLRDTNDIPADLTGSAIVSTRPIAVFSGHECASVPIADDFFCDYLVQQLFPVTLWGTNFLTVPYATRLNGDTFRCLAWQSSTAVYTNGALAGLINAGQYLEFQLGIASQITSSKTILVAQFADSSDYDGVMDADPFMCLVSPTALYANGYQVVIPPESYFPGTGNYLNVLTPTGKTVDLDGTAVTGPFTALGSSGYSWAQVPVNPGTHTIISVGGGLIGATAYGWAQYDAYGYPAGICTETNGATPQFVCPTNLIQIAASTSNNMAAVPDLTNQVGDADSVMSITQTPPPGTLVGPGSYRIDVTIIDEFGQSHLCQSTLIVTTQVPVVIQTATSSSGTIVLTWTDTAILQASPTPSGPWTNVAAARSPFLVEPVNKQYFYRTVLP